MYHQISSKFFALPCRWKKSKKRKYEQWKM